MVTHRVSVKCCHRGGFAATLSRTQGTRIISEGVEPPDRRRQVEGVDEGSRYVDVSHHYVLPGVRPVEAVLESQVGLEVRPEGPYDFMSEETLDEGSIVVGEDVSEDFDAFFAKRSIQLVTGRAEKLVLLLGLLYSLCRVQKEH